MSRNPAAPKGALALIGGRLELDNESIFSELRRLSGGRIAIFPTASGVPEEVGQEALEDFRGYGFEAEVLPVYGDNGRAGAADPAVLEAIDRLGSVYFTGGDQSRIIDAFCVGGKPSPALTRIRQRYYEGGLVAGSSAGAAMMSERIILSGTSLEALVDGVTDDVDEPGLCLGGGLGFFDWGMVDQHFIMRGRVGRLLVAMHACGYQFGYGVDENTGMFVQDGRMEILGETGVVVLDMRKATVIDGGRGFEGVRISYLDSGDSYDLRRRKILPARRKKGVRAGRNAFSSPAPFHRNAFGAYALHDLWLRLIQGKPGSYTRDAALAYEPHHETEVVVEIERLPRRSRALSTRTSEGVRYTAINFLLNVRAKPLGRAEWRDFQHRQVRSFFDQQAVAPEARLVVVGNAPTAWDMDSAEALLQHVAGPVGVIAAASRRAARTAEDYVDWFYRCGVEAEDLDITRGNIERVCQDRRLLERIAGMRTLLFTGGDQRRLVETLLHRGRPTDVLRAVAHAYERGARLMVVGAAASAVAASMIAEGTSCDALDFGASSDAGHEGVVIDEGLGFFALGLIDQNLIRRRRLGRLVIACAEQGVRYGFGLCEESGMVLGGSVSGMHATGKRGLVVVDLGQAETDASSGCFRVRGVRLLFVASGRSFDPDSARVIGPDDEGRGAELIRRLLEDLARECKTALVFEEALRPGSGMACRAGPAGSMVLDLQTRRGRY